MQYPHGSEQKGLMNDWEIGGTQNRWVCPSDRHLQLRAQLKSGWSVRTASARSPTSHKQNEGITEFEKEHIKAVLARAEEGKLREQYRIGKLIDRLEKMKARAAGNGIAQCYLCSTDFGLLAPKSYAAMCSQCRKYVCQKNCGVETYDCGRRENIFLCKICSEYREMWKKSGAWFYKEVPEYVKPSEDNETRTSPHSLRNWQHHAKPQPSNTTYQYRSVKTQRTKITPSWVREKVKSSMSVGSEEENASTSEEGELMKKDTESVAAQGRRPKSKKRAHGTIPNVHRFTVGAQSRFTDTEESGESRRTTPSTSPRHSPSSFGDDVSQNQSSVLASDAKSIDSGVVPSDYSAHANARLTIFPASADSLTMMAFCDEYGKTRDGRRSWSRTPSTTSSSGIQRPSPAAELHPVMEPQRGFEKELKDFKEPYTSVERKAPKTPESELHKMDGYEIGAINEIVHVKRNQILQAGLTSFADSSRQQRNFGKNQPLASIPSRPEEASESEQMMRGATPSPAPPIPPRSPQLGSLPSQQVSIIQKDEALMLPSEKAGSSTFSSSANKLGSSIEKHHSDNESRKMDEATTSAVCTSDERFKRSLSKRFRSPFHWRSKPKNAITRVMSDRITSTQSTVSLRSMVAAEEESIDQTNVRRAQSGSSIIAQQDDDNEMLGTIQFALRYSPDEKTLDVKLYSAKNLRAMDNNGFSDPYVKLYLLPGAAKATKMTSKTVEKCLNPEWKEEFTYHGITEEDKQKKTLRLLVLDRDRIGSDFLGEIRVPLRRLPSRMDKYFNLCLEHAMPVEKNDDPTERGKICIGLVYNVQQGSLFVTIRRCAELIGMDSTGFSDPYVKVSLLPLSHKNHRQKTTTKKRTLNPEFNETLSFVVPFKDLPKKTLQIGVYDKDVGKHDDYIGGVLLSTSAKGERQKQWNYCIKNPGNPSEQWYKLELLE